MLLGILLDYDLLLTTSTVLDIAYRLLFSDPGIESIRAFCLGVVLYGFLETLSVL